MATTKMTRSGQVTIPKTVREAWHLLDDTEFEVQSLEEGILFRPIQVSRQRLTLSEIVEAAQKDIAAGKVTRVKSSELEGFLDAL